MWVFIAGVIVGVLGLVLTSRYTRPQDAPNRELEVLRAQLLEKEQEARASINLLSEEIQIDMTEMSAQQRQQQNYLRVSVQELNEQIGRIRTNESDLASLPECFQKTLVLAQQKIETLKTATDSMRIESIECHQKLQTTEIELARTKTTLKETLVKLSKTEHLLDEAAQKTATQLNDVVLKLTKYSERIEQNPAEIKQLLAKNKYLTRAIETMGKEGVFLKSSLNDIIAINKTQRDEISQLKREATELKEVISTFPHEQDDQNDQKILKCVV